MRGVKPENKFDSLVVTCLRRGRWVVVFLRSPHLDLPAFPAGPPSCRSSPAVVNELLG